MFKFLMDVDEYKKAIKFYGEKFKLKSRWVVSVVDSFPSEWKMNYENSEKVVACTNWMTTTVLFKSSLLTMPAFLVVPILGTRSGTVLRWKALMPK